MGSSGPGGGPVGIRDPGSPTALDRPSDFCAFRVTSDADASREHEGSKPAASGHAQPPHLSDRSARNGRLRRDERLRSGGGRWAGRSGRARRRLHPMQRPGRADRDRAGGPQPHHPGPRRPLRPRAQGGPPRAPSRIPVGDAGPPAPRRPSLRRGPQPLLALGMGGQGRQGDLGHPARGLLPHPRKGQERLRPNRRGPRAPLEGLGREGRGGTRRRHPRPHSR